MKKLSYLFFFFILLSIFSVYLVSATTSCTPPTGYDECDKNSYGSASAKLYFAWEGNGRTIDGIQYIRKNLFHIGYSGNRLYEYDGIDSWSDVDCDENGCNGKRVSSGDINVGSPGEEISSCTAFVAWDTDSNTGDWTWVGRGFVGNCVTERYVECSKDTQCGGGYFCDMNGSWQTWKCKQVPLIPCDLTDCSSVLHDNCSGTGSWTVTGNKPSCSCSWQCTPECTTGSIQNSTCSCGKQFAYANCADGQWHPIYYILDPCLTLCANQTNQTCPMYNPGLCPNSTSQCPQDINPTTNCPRNRCDLCSTGNNGVSFFQKELFNIKGFSVTGLIAIIALIIAFLLWLIFQ